MATYGKYTATLLQSLLRSDYESYAHQRRVEPALPHGVLHRVPQDREERRHHQRRRLVEHAAVTRTASSTQTTTMRRRYTRP